MMCLWGGKPQREPLLEFEVGDLLDEEAGLLARLSNETKLGQVGRHIRVSAQIAPMERSQEVLKDFEVRWVQTDGKHSFVLTSRMIHVIGNGGALGIRNPDAELWFPLSPNLCLVLRRDPSRQFQLMNVISRDHLRPVNEYMVRNSSRVASSSRKLLTSLTRQTIVAS